MTNIVSYKTVISKLSIPQIMEYVRTNCYTKDHFYLSRTVNSLEKTCCQTFLPTFDKKTNDEMTC